MKSGKLSLGHVFFTGFMVAGGAVTLFTIQTMGLILVVGFVFASENQSFMQTVMWIPVSLAVLLAFPVGRWVCRDMSEEAPVEEEYKYRKPIFNGVKCLECFDIIESWHVHDFKSCKCGNISVDGGLEYARRVFKSESAAYIELSRYEGEEE